MFEGIHANVKHSSGPNYVCYVYDAKQAPTHIPLAFTNFEHVH